MDKNVTVSVRGLMVAGLVVLALALAYFVGAAGGDAAGASDQTPAPAPAAGQPRRTVTMAGVGTTTAVPDQLAFEVSVLLLRDDLDTALADTNALMTRVLTTLRDEGVAKRDIQTTGLSMNPVYDYPAYGGRVFLGYRVGQRVSAAVDLADGGQVISAAVATGGNGVRVEDLRLQISDPDAVMTEARAAAVEQATAKAEEYAAATGQELGDVVTLTEVAGPRDGYRDSYGQSSRDYKAADLAAVPIRAGETDLTARVQVVWELQ